MAHAARQDENRESQKYGYSWAVFVHGLITFCGVLSRYGHYVNMPISNTGRYLDTSLFGSRMAQSTGDSVAGVSTLEVGLPSRPGNWALN